MEKEFYFEFSKKNKTASFKEMQEKIEKILKINFFFLDKYEDVKMFHTFLHLQSVD